MINPTIMKILVLSCIALLALCEDPTPPVWPVRFQEDFVQGYKTTTRHVIGRIFFDSERKMSKHDKFCSSVTDGAYACTQLVREDKRYMIYPQLKKCCVCCDASHGCGVMRRDWLDGAKYEGKEDLLGQTFFKFSKPDGDALDYYWYTTDGKNVPRKMTEIGSRFKDFIMTSYTEEYIADKQFALPSYCDPSNLCPSTTVCGQLRGEKPSLQQM